MEIIYYRSVDARGPLYRVEAPSVPAAKGGGFDLSKVPAGNVSVFKDGKWEAATLPAVGNASGCVRHTKNTAGVGVEKKVAAAKPAAGKARA